jgi:hypothetical protein
MLEDDDIQAALLYDAVTTLAVYEGLKRDVAEDFSFREMRWEMEVAAESIALDTRVGVELEETDPERGALQVKLLTFLLGDANLERIDDHDAEILNRNIIQVAEHEIISRMRGVITYINALDQVLLDSDLSRRVIELVINRLNFELHETSKRIKEEEESPLALDVNIDYVEEMEREQDILQWFMVYLQEAAQLADRPRD